MNTNLNVVAFVAITAAVLAACSGEAANDQMPPPPQVSVAPVVVKEVRQWDNFTGRIDAVESVELRPRVSGYIERVNFAEGSEVSKGDVLFVIDQRRYRSALTRAEAELERARAEAELARTDVTRARKLSEAKAISAEELDQRQSALTRAEANVRAAEAAVETAALDFEYTEVTAPVAGRIGRAMVTTGNLVSTEPNATLLTTIVSIDPVYVYFEGSEQDFLHSVAISGGGGSNRYPVRVGLAGEQGYPHQGMLDFVDNRVDPETGTIRARAVLPNPDRALIPGQFARVQLLARDPFVAVLIDDRGVLTDQDRKYVYVVGGDGTAMRRDVRLGRVIEGLRVVESGLEAGDRVIVYGVQKVFFPGMPVQAQEIAMGDPPPAPGAAGGPMEH